MRVLAGSMRVRERERERERESLSYPLVFVLPF